MYTLCPRCRTIHPLDARTLAQAGGSVRCGQCGLAFDALKQLFDERPDGRAAPPLQAAARPSPPVLGAGEASAAAAEAGVELPPLPRGRRWPWRLVAVVLVVATLLNAAWVFRERIAARPEVRDWLAEHGVPGFQADGPFRDPERIHLVSRDFHAHPSRPGVLVLSATFVNLATRPQPLPELEVTLTDADNRLLASRRFTPIEYVLPGSDPQAALQPGVHTPILLEFVDPGEHAVGFELTFH